MERNSMLNPVEHDNKENSRRGYFKKKKKKKKKRGGRRGLFQLTKAVYLFNAFCFILGPIGRVLMRMLVLVLVLMQITLMLLRRVDLVRLRGPYSSSGARKQLESVVSLPDSQQPARVMPQLLPGGRELELDEYPRRLLWRQGC